MTTKAIAKAINTVEPGGPSMQQRDFLGVKIEGVTALVSIPSFTRVEVYKTEKGSDGVTRDHFTILDFENAGRKASLSHTAAGSKLVDRPKYRGPCLVDSGAKRGTVEVSVPSDPSIAKVTATSTSEPLASDGTYKLRPWLSLKKEKVTNKKFVCETYLDENRHACHWWKFQCNIEQSYCLHRGTRSSGCFSVIQNGGWQAIYEILTFCRTADGAFTGDIRIKGHSLLTS